MATQNHIDHGLAKVMDRTLGGVGDNLLHPELLLSVRSRPPELVVAPIAPALDSTGHQARAGNAPTHPDAVYGRPQGIAGVCGGIAEYLGWPAGRVHLLYVLVSLFSAGFPGIVVYLILWFLMPTR